MGSVKDSIKDSTAIVGIAQTEFSADSGRTEYSLACEAIKAAIDDAGIDYDDVDGVVKDTVDGIDSMYIQKAVGIDKVMYLSDSYFGTIPLINAVTALASGISKYVVYYRSANNGSGNRAGSDFRAARETKDNSLDMFGYDLYAPFGLLTPEAKIAMSVRRYYSDLGARPEQIGWVPVVASEHAAVNPHAGFCDTPMTIDDYLASPLVADPIRKADVAPNVDGAIAMVLTTVERAKDLPNTPAIVRAVAQGMTGGEDLSNYDRDTLSTLPEMALLAGELFKVADMTPADIEIAMLDDRFAPLVPMQLEALGFCGAGEGAAFCEGGANLRVGGRLALNTNGGFWGEGFSYGSNVIEAVRQIRGTSTSQVDGASTVLVTSGAGGPADGVILAR